MQKSRRFVLSVLIERKKSLVLVYHSAHFGRYSWKKPSPVTLGKETGSWGLPCHLGKIAWAEQFIAPTLAVFCPLQANIATSCSHLLEWYGEGAVPPTGTPQGQKRQL